jgi:CubicO group peptidase (beta-lactamase class C family)
MRTALIAFIVSVCLLAGTFHPSVIAPASADFAAIDSYLDAQRKAQRIPGMAVVIVKEDRVIYQQGYGEAAPGRAVTIQTPFILGSTSKSFTALAVMQLVDAGKLDLDVPVMHYLPWFTLTDTNAAQQITTRMLLNHMSGLPTSAGEDRLAENDNEPEALYRKVHGLSQVVLAHRPGTTFEYCNSNYDILGLLIETASGQSYGEYIETHIFDPLGMHHSYTARLAAEGDHLAAGYRYWFGLPFPAGQTPFSYANLPSGKLIVSAADLGPYLMAQLNAGRYQSLQLVSTEGMRLMHTPVLGSYAMGWASQGSLLAHNGAIPDFGSSFLLDPQRKIGLALLWNVNTGGGNIPAYGLAGNVWRLLTDQQPEPIPTDLTYTNYLSLLGGLLVLELIWLAVSLKLLSAWRSKPVKIQRKVRVSILAALVQVGLCVILIMMLIQQQRPLPVMFLFVPDLTVLAMLFLALALLWSGLFPALAFWRGKKVEA